MGISTIKMYIKNIAISNDNTDIQGGFICMDFFIPSGRSKGSEDGNLKWWQLSLIGIGCTIGTGFFLGSAIGIKITGPSTRVFLYISCHWDLYCI